MTKQGSVVRTTWSHNSLVSPRCTPGPAFKRWKEEVGIPLAFLIESFHGVVKIQRLISRFISGFVFEPSHCLGKDLQKDFNLNCWTCLSRRPFGYCEVSFSVTVTKLMLRYFEFS
ncbi:hypothetical protein CDAR_171531 [Caerostris darwini]|uniref:Uncharacterized protein n=1 Tax=Caerostris darwini TaxID=1538125 RepID=A0AAV4WPT2_9ARAC|nr:hypothetical protein CDAR_171531 [Caerostris darwini]